MAKQMLGEGNLGSPDRRPCFYKIIWMANLIDLRIPPDFKKHLRKIRNDRMTLRTAAGKWHVKLIQDEEDDIYFVEGWKEFVKHHFLGNAEFLLFKYNGDMSFDVVIFDKNGSAREYQSDRKSHQRSESSIASCFPFFKYEIKDYNIGIGGFMQIPQAFTKRHLQSSKQTMILRNSAGTSWPVNISVTAGNALAMCGGWKVFLNGNSIKKGDVCIFELVEQNVMQVHIFK